jgi:hypothetical protein
MRAARWLLLVAALATAYASDWSAGFPDPPQSHDMGVYWWWFGPAVTKQEVTRELDVMRAAHIGNVLIYPIYPISADDPAHDVRNLRYLSKEFLEVLQYTVKEAGARGIAVDVAMGSGWPFGGPGVTPAHAAKRLRVDVQPALGGASVRFPALKLDEKLLGAWLVKGNGRRVDLAGAIDLMPRFRADRAFHLPSMDPAPRTLLTFIESPTLMKVKRASLGGEGLVLDHLSREALQYYLKAVGDKLVAGSASGIRAIHSDSMEVFRADWTESLPAEFKRRRGYDLKPWLPALVAEAGAATADVRYDFWRTVSELASDNYVRPLADWCHGRGVKLQAESYGTPPVDLHSYAKVDQIMGEGMDWKMFVASRWASSAAHQFGRKVTAAEAYTWLRHPRYVETLEDLKLGSDLHFACGANHIVAHGYGYSPPTAGVPGWGYYASVMLNDNNTWWPHFPLLADYVRRTSYALTLGKPQVDVALYLPEDDVMAGQALGQGLNLYMSTKALLAGQRVAEFGLPSAFSSETPVIKTLVTSGFSFDGIDRGILQSKLRTSHGKVEVGDVAYRIVVLPNVRGISVAAMERLAEFCRTGGTLIATRRVPEAAYGLQHREANYARVRRLSMEMFGAGAPDQVRRRGYGKGTAIYVPDDTVWLAAVLASLDPEIRFERPDADLVFAHRGEGARNLYFLANTSATEKYVRATFRDGRGQAQFWDAMDGSVTGGPQGNTIALDLEPHGSILVFFNPEAPEMAEAPERQVGEPEIVTAAWTLEIAGRNTQFGAPRLWTEFPVWKHFSGRGVYRAEIEVPASALGEGRGVWLELGQVREIAEVAINGQPAGVAWKEPYRIDITKWAHAGKNTLEVGVTNLLINRVLGEPAPDYKGLEPLRFPRPDEKKRVAQPLPSGLAGPVKLIPYTLTQR